MDSILIVDDDRAFCDMLAELLRSCGYSVVTAGNGPEAMETVTEEPALVFLDLKMDGDSKAGLGVLAQLKERFVEVPVVMLTAFGDVSSAVAAMKSGALDFLEKPVDVREIRRIASSFLAGEEEASVSEPAGVWFGGICSRNAQMKETVGLLRCAAEVDAPVLITGDSGTGKELAAAFIHQNSPRCRGPFITVNCSAIPEGLVETEMFGCVSGAFSGAMQAREGRFSAADGGTLFLDEIGEMNVALQAKLLRVLQEKTFEKVGSPRPVRVDVRIVAATNRPVEEAIRDGRLREDLYYRINLFQIRMPSLRERMEDILPLAQHFLGQEGGDRPVRLSWEARDRLWQHPWPGNIRELRNVMERARILARGGVIRTSHFPFQRDGVIGSATSVGMPTTVTSVHDMELELIRQALARTGGNRTEAARQLGISRRALLYKIKRFDIS